MPDTLPRVTIPSPTIDAAELTPGAYLTLRREAAGLSIDDVALLYAHSAIGRPAAAMMIGAAEADQHPLPNSAFDRLATCLPLDETTYYGLVEGLPVAPICRACGTSWADPCGRATGACAWRADA